MPYISAEKQKNLNEVVDAIDAAEIFTSGELNFLLTKLAVRYIQLNGTRYQFMNDVVGALDGAKVEFQRRIVEPYERQKAFEAGQNNSDPYQGSC